MTLHIEYCHNCGSAISEPSVFCASCGARLAEPEPIGTHTSSANSAATGAQASLRDVPSAPATGVAPSREPLAKTSPQGATAKTPALPNAPSNPGSAAAQGARHGVNAPAENPPGNPAPGTSGPLNPAPGATGPGNAPPGNALPGNALPGTAPPGTPPAGTPPGGPWGTTPPPAEQPSKSGHNWIPIAVVSGGVLVALALVVVLLITLGGSAGKDVKSASATREQALQLLAANGTTTVSRAAPGLFALVNAGQLSAVVPAGWRSTAQTAANATRAEFADPAHPTSTVTIVAQKGGSNDSRGQALAARRTVSSKGNTIASFGHVSFPGGREAWRLIYTGSGATHATYFFPACNTHVAMVVDVSAAASAFQREQVSLEALAASAEPKC